MSTEQPSEIYYDYNALKALDKEGYKKLLNGLMRSESFDKETIKKAILVYGSKSRFDEKKFNIVVTINKNVKFLV